MNISVERLPVRISALLLLNMGETRTNVSRYLGVSRVTLVEWSRRFREGGWGALLRENRRRTARGSTHNNGNTAAAVNRKSTSRRRR